MNTSAKHQGTAERKPSASVRLTIRDDMAPFVGDDYDRTGCRAVIHVNPYGFGLFTYAPNGALMEVYANEQTPAGIAQLVEAWCAGKLPPRLQQPDLHGAQATVLRQEAERCNAQPGAAAAMKAERLRLKAALLEGQSSHAALLQGGI